MSQVTSATYILIILLTLLQVTHQQAPISVMAEKAKLEPGIYKNSSFSERRYEDKKLIGRERVSALSYPSLSGFPLEIPEGMVHNVSPTVADLDNNGDNELLVANSTGKVYIYDSLGQLEQTLTSKPDRKVSDQLAVGDLDKDGDLEIVAGISTKEDGVAGHVYVWQHDGTLFPGWPQRVARFGDARPSLISSVVLADVDGDTDLEIIAATNNNLLGTPQQGTDYEVPDLYVWQRDGTLLSGNWPAKDGPGIKGHVAAGDLDSDTKTDILTGRDYSWFFVYDRQGNDLPGWPVQTLVNGDDQIVHKTSGPVVADLDGDGTYECIVAGLRTPSNSDTRINNDLLVFQEDGTPRSGWETPAAGSGVLSGDEDMHQTPAIGDLDNDHQLDIVVPTQDGKIRAYTHDKTKLWQFGYSKGKFIYASEPVIGDVDGDGFNEVLFGTYDPDNGTTSPTAVWILEHDGTVKGKLDLDDPGTKAAPTLTDLDGNGTLDILAVTRRGKIYAWDTGISFNIDHLPWPVARHDLWRTGFFDATSFNGRKTASPFAAARNEVVTYRLRLVRSGPPLTATIRITDFLPTGVTYITDTLTATHGIPNDTLAPALGWTGRLSDTPLIEISYRVQVTETIPVFPITNSAVISSLVTGEITRSASFLANPRRVYLPTIFQEF